MSIYTIATPSADNLGVESRLGTDTTAAGSVQGRLNALLTLLGTLGDAAGLDATKGLLPRLTAIAALIDGLKSTLGTPDVNPPANSIQQRLQAIIDRLGAVTSPLTGATTAITANTTGVQLAPAAPAGTSYRLVTIQVESGSPVSIFNGNAATGTPRLKGLQAGMVYIISHRGQLFGATTSGTSICNVTLDS